MDYEVKMVIENKTLETLQWFVCVGFLIFGFGVSLLLIGILSATFINVNATDSSGNNYSFTIDMPNQTFIYNYTVNQIINQTINQTVIYNITNITCINCTYNLQNYSGNQSYTKIESDNIYVLKTDLQNFKTIELPSIYLLKTEFNSNFSEISQIKNNFTDFNARLDDNSFTPMWKMLVVITIILCLIAFGFSAKAIMG